MIGDTEIVFGLMAFSLVYFILGYPLQDYVWRRVRPSTERALINKVRKHHSEEKKHRQLRQEAEFELRELRKKAREVAA